MTQVASELHDLYIKIDTDVVDSALKPMALALYVTIARHIDRSRNKVQASLKRLAEWSGMGCTSVQKYTKQLEEAGLIVVYRQKCDGSKENEVNVYMLAGSPANTTCGDWDVERNLAEVHQNVREVHRNSPGNHSFLNHDDDDEKDDDIDIDFSLQEKEEKQFAQDGEIDPETPSMRLLKKYGVRGKRLRLLKNTPQDLIMKWVDYGLQKGKIRNFGGWLAENLLSQELPPEISEKGDESETQSPDAPETNPQSMNRPEMPESWVRGYDLLREFGIFGDEAFKWSGRASIDMFDVIDKGWRVWFEKNPPKNPASYLLKMIREKKAPPYWNHLEDYTGEKPSWAKENPQNNDNSFAGMDWGDFTDKATARRGRDYYKAGKYGDIINC